MKLVFSHCLVLITGTILGYASYVQTNSIYCSERGHYILRNTISKKYAIVLPYSGGSLVSLIERVPDDYEELSIVNGTNYGIKFFCTNKEGEIMGDWHQANPKSVMALSNSWCDRVVPVGVGGGKK